MRISPRAIGFGLVFVVIVATVVWGVVGERSSTGNSPAATTQTDTSPSSTETAAPQEELSAPSELTARVMTFMLLYQSPLSQLRSDALRLICTGELSWQGLNAEYVPTAESEELARTVTVRIDQKADNTVTIKSQDDGVVVVEATAHFIVKRPGMKTAEYAATRTTEWNDVSGEWKLAKVLS